MSLDDDISAQEDEVLSELKETLRQIEITCDSILKKLKARRSNSHE